MALPPVAAVPVQAPEPPVEPQIGNLNNRDIDLLYVACRNQHEEKGAVIGRILSVASLVAGLFAAIMVPGAMGIILGLADYVVVGDLLCNTYHSLRNQDYAEAGLALRSTSFKEYIVRREVVPTIDNIATIHKAYKGYAAEQAQQLVAAPV